MEKMKLSFERDVTTTYGFSWPQRDYTCTFCKKKFMSAQALGGHMNVHRRDRAKLRESSPSNNGLNPNPNPNPITNPNPNPRFSYFPYGIYSLGPSFGPFSSSSIEEGKSFLKKKKRIEDESSLDFKKTKKLSLTLDLGIALNIESREPKEDLDLELRLGLV